MLRISCQVFSRNGVGSRWLSSNISLQNINENNTIKDLLLFDCVVCLGMEKIKTDSLEGLTLSKFEKELYEFAENNDMRPVLGDSFEDADGNIIHESEVIEMMEREEAEEFQALDEARRDADRRSSHELAW